MKTIKINIKSQTATYNGISTTFEELGLSHTDITDMDEIKDDLIDLHGDDIEVIFES